MLYIRLRIGYIKPNKKKLDTLYKNENTNIPFMSTFVKSSEAEYVQEYIF